MPRYSSRRKNASKRERKRVRAAMPRDKRHLSHWAVRGTHDDYHRLRKHTENVRDRAPSYIHQQTLDKLQSANRRSMLENINSESWGGTWFTDGLSWLIDQVPTGWGWEWPKAIGQAALKPFRGDSLDETDQQYARLVEQSYRHYEGTAPDQFEHWQRQPEFDSDYVTVWDNEDGHRFISVRGTEFTNVKDLKEDWQIAQSGTSDNLIGGELKKILNHTKPDKVVDLGAHSLGTSLAFTAFQSDDSLQSGVLPVRATTSTRRTTGSATSSTLATPLAWATSARKGRPTSSTGTTGTQSRPTSSYSGVVKQGSPNMTRAPRRKSRLLKLKRKRTLKTTIMTEYRTTFFQWIWETITRWIWGTPSTRTPGSPTGSSELRPLTWSPHVKRPLRKQRMPNGRPPLAPKRQAIDMDDHFWDDVEMKD